MAVTGLESMKGDGMGVFARKNRLQVESTIVAGDTGDGSEAQVSEGRLHTKALMVSEDGIPAVVDSDGRLLTSARVPCVPKVVHTSYISGGANAVGALNSRADRCSMLFMNTGGNTVYIRLAGSDPTASDISLAAGEKFAVPFTTDSEVRFVATTGNWSVVAVEGAES